MDAGASDGGEGVGAGEHATKARVAAGSKVLTNRRPITMPVTSDLIEMAHVLCDPTKHAVALRRLRVTTSGKHRGLQATG